MSSTENLIFVLQIILCGIGLMTADECANMHEPKLLRSCCKVPYTDEVIKNCSINLMTPKADDPPHMAETRKNKVALHICVAECEFMAKGYLFGLDDLNFKAIEDDMTKRYFNDLDYAILFQNSIHECFEFARNKTKEISWLKTEDGCNFFPSILLGCTYQQIIKNCPSNKWHSTPKCDGLKEFLNKCDSLKATKIIK